MADPSETLIRIGIGLIARDNRFLIRQRRPGQIMSGVWEFPGGKCEPGESPDAAAARECHEEVGFPVIIERLRARIEHRYPHGWLQLSYYDCRAVDPVAEPAVGSGFVWVAVADLSGYTFPGANESVIAALVSEGR